MKTILFCIALLTLSLNAKAVKIKFMVANTSVNVAEGSTGVFTAFELYPSTFIDSTDDRGLIDFESINYNDISEIVMEKMLLNIDITLFSRLTSFTKTDTATFGFYDDIDIVQGNTYAYRLSVITKTGQQINLLLKSMTPEIADPKMNCAKLNNVYRLAGHNNFQESVISPPNGGFYKTLDFTRVVELDVHASNNPTTWNWSVRHTSFPFGCSGNCNNCGFNPATGKADGDKPFGVCIDDLKKWHNDHPNHDVIILFIDLKSDWNENNNGQTPADLDFRLLSLVPSADMIYKPRDLLGNSNSSNFGNMRLATQQNNWPSMGDLTGKLMFVLTGDGSKVTDYITDRSLGAVAFCAANVKEVADVADPTRPKPDIGWWAVNDIVFYNNDFSDINNGQGPWASGDGYINRVWGSLLGFPETFSNSKYADAIDEAMNNIATKLVWEHRNPTNGKPVNGIQRPIRAEKPLIDGSRIYSTYENVTQAATQTITATNLIVEQGTHFRMFAGQEIDLQPGVDFQPGSDVDVRIDDCRTTDYTQRQNTQTGEQLTQEEIDKLMHELNKELYGYQPESEKEIVNLMVYPNPTNNLINISYTQFLTSPSTFTLYDITGRVVKTQLYTPPTEGKQQISVSIAQLKEGSYFYTLQVGEQLYNGKVVKINQ
ncbi:MAG: Ca2+-dependent phosphoinositide-specific phospholipase C [Vicingaceae bacterium]|nr:Ca2+-dependent phosphoinositide-specific phospholipase C [Vicingaceae bacterium]